MHLKSQRLSYAAIIVAASGGLRTVVALGVRSLVASKFGISSGETDAYMAALTVPQILGDYLVGGAVFFAIMPVFARVRTQRGELEAWQLLAAVGRIAIVALLGMTLAYAALARPVMRAMAPGFKGDQVDLAVGLARLLSPAMFLMGMTLIGASVIQSFRHFWATATASLLPQLCCFGSIWLLSSRLGINSWAVGQLVGLGAQLVIYVAVLASAGMRLGPRLKLNDPAVRDVGRLALPLLVGILIGQANTIVPKYLASRVAAGISSLSYSQTLQMLPLSLVIAPLTGAMFPLLAQQAAANARGEVRSSCGLGIRMVLFIGAPAAVVLIVARQPLVALLFEWGKFGPEQTKLVSRLLLYHALAIPFAGGAVVLHRALCALERAGDLFVVSICRGAASLINFILFPCMGVAGLALAACLVHVVTCACAFVLLSRRVGVVVGPGDAGPVVKILVSSFAVAALAWIVSSLCPASNIINFGAVVAVVGAGYVGIAAALRSPELSLIWTRLLRRQ